MTEPKRTRTSPKTHEDESAEAVADVGDAAEERAKAEVETNKFNEERNAKATPPQG